MVDTKAHARVASGRKRGKSLSSFEIGEGGVMVALIFSEGETRVGRERGSGEG